MLKTKFLLFYCELPTETCGVIRPPVLTVTHYNCLLARSLYGRYDLSGWWVKPSRYEVNWVEIQEVMNNYYLNVKLFGVPNYEQTLYHAFYQKKQQLLLWTLKRPFPWNPKHYVANYFEFRGYKLPPYIHPYTAEDVFLGLNSFFDFNFTFVFIALTLTWLIYLFHWRSFYGQS